MHFRVSGLYAAWAERARNGQRADSETGKKRALVDGAGGLARGPVLRGKLDTPEMRTGGKELEADAGAFVGSVAQIDDAAVLLFFGNRVDEDDFGADSDRLLQVNKATVGVDDDRLCVFAEFAAVHILAASADGDARKDPGAAAFLAGVRVGHGHKLSCNASGSGVNRR
jgi:hypothetical protein